VNPFRTVQNRLLSLWHSSVMSTIWRALRRDEQPTLSLDAFRAEDEATADYCDASYELSPHSWTLAPLDDVLQVLGDRPLARMSAISHHLAVAEFFGDAPLALRIRRKLRPFEEGKGNALFWWDCVTQHQEHLTRARDVTYHSSMFGGRLQPRFSVIDDVLSDSARVGLVGDWGTGEPVASSVLQALLDFKPDIVIHLGDIYRSGTEDECERYFRAIIRDRLKFEGPVYVLAGNHDYYSGGTAYFALLDVMNDSRTRQPASFFNLRNNYWQILAMDTGHNDSVPLQLLSERKAPALHVSPLRDDEIAWHEYQLRNAGGRRTMLLSHHQVGSLSEKIREVKHDSLNPALFKVFEPFFETGYGPGIATWFWGHEHHLVEFERHYHGLPLGCCIGHGAIPVHKSSKPVIRYRGAPPTPSLGSLGLDSEGYLNRGFAMVHLDGPKATIEHWQVDESGSAGSLGIQQL
jgi:hypothetical protein